MSEEEFNSYHVLAVERTMNILEVLKGGAFSLTAVAEKTGIHKSTVLRFLATLVEMGYAVKDEGTELFSLTAKMNGFSVLDRQTADLKEIAQPYLEKLARESGETIHFAVLSNNELHYLTKIESEKTLRVAISSHTGGSAPLYCTGLGKVLLSSLSGAQRNALVDAQRFEKFTPTTLNGRDELLGELAEIERIGYAIDNEEHEEGVTCYAAPVKRNGAIVAAISVTGPTFRMQAERERLIELVMGAARQISILL